MYCMYTYVRTYLRFYVRIYERINVLFVCHVWGPLDPRTLCGSKT